MDVCGCELLLPRACRRLPSRHEDRFVGERFGRPLDSLAVMVGAAEFASQLGPCGQCCNTTPPHFIRRIVVEEPSHQLVSGAFAYVRVSVDVCEVCR